MPSVEELSSYPVRLRELRRQCWTDRATLGDVFCNRVAEATRGDGETLYTPPENPPKF